MNYSAMTVNERLWASGDFDDYREAIERKDTSKVIEILRKVEVPNDSILAILNKYELEIPLENMN